MTAANDLDPEGIDRLRRIGGAKFTAEMIALFLSYGREKLSEAHRAQAEGNLGGVQKAVHPLKSSAGNVGAARMQELAVEAERKAGEQESDAVRRLLHDLEIAYQAVKPLLEAERERALLGEGSSQ